MGEFIMLRGKGESLLKMVELLEMNKNKTAIGVCGEVGAISA